MDLDSCDKIFDHAMSSQTEADFCYAIAPLFHAYEILSVGLGRGSIFWRARLVEGAPWPNLSDVDYPPAERARLGRLNDAGQSCFYAATDIQTALLEVEAQEGQLIQVAGFRVLSDQILRLILVGEYAHVQKKGYMQFTGTDPGRTIQKMLNEHDARSSVMLYIDKFLASILADSEARNSSYRFSRAVGAMLHSKVHADGIVFPSVRDPGGFNLAVKPNPSDQSLHNVACLLIRVGRLRRFRVLDHQIVSSAQQLDDDQSFVWPERYEQGRLNLYGMNKEEFDFSSKHPDDRNAMSNLFSMYSIPKKQRE